PIEHEQTVVAPPRVPRREVAVRESDGVASATEVTREANGGSLQAVAPCSSLDSLPPPHPRRG
ncbi:MAG: hypothetical protein ACNA8W_26435, partial [Bradymonadaceae bacterium]